MESQLITTQLGSLRIYWQNDDIYRSEFVNDTTGDQEIITYLTGSYKIILEGTPFQKEVWQEIIKIPCGQVRTYSDIAKTIGRPNSYRAVANACGQNKIALFVPCHRVIGKSNLGGYKWGLDKKKALLELEANY